MITLTNSKHHVRILYYPYCEKDFFRVRTQQQEKGSCKGHAGVMWGMLQVVNIQDTKLIPNLAASFTSRAANQKLTFTQTITHQPAFLNSSNSNEQEVEEKEREENEKERDHKRGFVIQRAREWSRGPLKEM